ncbi:MAG: nucleoside triphosphate pyrophosphohydrolase [Planctomycetota bacterium]
MPERLAALRRLVEVIDRLRAPDGCPWDCKQTIDTMTPLILEEAFEVADAAARKGMATVAEELGDLLMNIVLTAKIAEQAGDFSLREVAEGITEKLVRRHPHVFGSTEVASAGEVLRNWEAIKREERRGAPDSSVLAGVPRALPALLRALRVGEKAARVGFEWPHVQGALDKVREELGELERGLTREGGSGGDPEALEWELGDVLFALVNVARHLKLDPEMALRRAIDRFESRFRYIEEKLGDRLERSSLEELDRLWEEAKAREGA